MTASLETLGLRWYGVPIHSIQRAAGILGTSQHRIEELLEDGTLKAVVFTGEKEKRLVTTESLVEFLATAQEWTPPLMRSPPKRKSYDGSPGEPYEDPVSRAAALAQVRANVDAEEAGARAEQARADELKE